MNRIFTGKRLIVDLEQVKFCRKADTDKDGVVAIEVHLKSGEVQSALYNSFLDVNDDFKDLGEALSDWASGK